MIINTALFLFWMLAVPALSGLCFINRKNRICLSEALVCGSAFTFALAQVLSLLFMAAALPLHLLCLAYGGIAGLMSLLGLGLYAVDSSERKKNRNVSEGRTGVSFWWKDHVFLIAAFLLVIVIAVYVSQFAHYDADDGFYVAMAVTEKYTDSIFAVNPYTGAAYTKLPSRYVLSQNPTFLAVLSCLSKGMHPAELAHVLYPLAMLPLAFAVWHLLGRLFFPEDGNMQGIFVIIILALTWFSGYSIYNSGVFFLTRIWQGKGILAGIWIPMLIWLAIETMTKKQSSIPAVVLGMGVLGACLLSSMGVVLAPVTAGIIILYGAAVQKNTAVLLKGAACLLPAVALGVIYIIIR